MAIQSTGNSMAPSIDSIKSDKPELKKPEDGLTEKFESMMQPKERAIDDGRTSDTALFNVGDRDQSNTLKPHEFKKAMRGVIKAYTPPGSSQSQGLPGSPNPDANPSDKYLSDLRQAADIDGSGDIDRNEWNLLMDGNRLATSQTGEGIPAGDELSSDRALFNVADRNDDNSLNCAEFKRAAKGIMEAYTPPGSSESVGTPGSPNPEATPNHEFLKDLYNASDFDGFGGIDRNEFNAVMDGMRFAASIIGGGGENA